MACAYRTDEAASRPDDVASAKPIRDRIESQVRGYVRFNHRTQPQTMTAGRPI